MDSTQQSNEESALNSEYVLHSSYDLSLKTDRQASGRRRRFRLCSFWLSFDARSTLRPWEDAKSTSRDGNVVFLHLRKELFTAPARASRVQAISMEVTGAFVGRT